MIPQNFTHKSQEALQNAQQLAFSERHAMIAPLHLLMALLEQEDGVVPAVLKKLSLDTRVLIADVRTALERRPRVGNSSGGAVQPSVSPDVIHTLEEADRIADRIAIIDHGVIVTSGTGEELKIKTETKSLEEAFLKLTGKNIRADEASTTDVLRMHRRMWRR